MKRSRALEKKQIFCYNIVMESEVKEKNKKINPPTSMIDTKAWDNLNIAAPDGTTIIEIDQTEKKGRNIIAE